MIAERRDVDAVITSELNDRFFAIDGVAASIDDHSRLRIIHGLCSFNRAEFAVGLAGAAFNTNIFVDDESSRSVAVDGSDGTLFHAKTALFTFVGDDGER